MRRHIFIGSLLTVLLVGGFFVFDALPKKIAGKKSEILLGGQTFKTDIARTPLERGQGLSGRESLAEDEAMLFIFDSADYHGFWMKDMRFAIDMIWIKGDKIIGWKEYAEPDDDPERVVYYPPEPADKVLEVRAGTVFRLGLKIDDTIKF